MRKIKKVILFLILNISCFYLYSQNPSDICGNKMVWFGLDFSKAVFVGSSGFTNPIEIKNKFFPAWNDVIIIEKEKFNLEKFFRKTDVTYDLSTIEERNKMPDPDKMVTYNNNELKESDISAIISEYKTNEKEGLGLVLIVENFNKLENKAYVFVTFFDIPTKKVLLTKRLTGKPVGIALRNYWTGAIYNIFKQIDNSRFTDWKKQYCN